MVFRRCVICSDNCDPLDDPEENRNETSLLRLLDINLDLERSTGQSTNSNSDINIRNKLLSLNNSDSYDDLEKAPYYGIYCSNCESRNQEIFELFAKVDLFSKQLEEIKTTLKNDFTNCYHHQDSSSVLRDVDPQDNNIVGLQEKRCQLLRTLIAKSFKLTTDSDDNNSLDISPGTNLQQQNIVDDDDDQDVDGLPFIALDVSYSDSESEDKTHDDDLRIKTEAIDSTPEQSSSYLHHLKNQCGIKEVKIALERLSPDELLIHSTRRENSRRQSIRKSINKAVTRSGLSQIDRGPHRRRQLIKCIFADCPSKKSFRTTRDRDLHVKLLHKGVCENNLNNNNNFSSSESSQENSNSSSVPPRLSLKSKLRCIFADCDSGLYFTTESERELHCKVSHGINTKESVNGPQPSKSLKTKNQNLKKTTKKTLKAFKCIFADCTFRQTFRTETERDLHVRTAHEDHITGEPGTNSVNDNGDKDATAQQPPTRFPCLAKDCNNRVYFYSQEDLLLHTKNAHEGYECEICHKKFRHNKEKEIHVDAAHHGVFPFMCDYCGKGFTCMGSLKVHLPSHTGERNYKCSTCQDTFKTASGLLYHVRKVHTGERPYKCTYDKCEKRFVTASKLSNHVKCVHNKHERPITCKLCGKGFPITNYLTLHMRTHRKHVEESVALDEHSSSSSHLQQTTTTTRRKRRKPNRESSLVIDFDSSKSNSSSADGDQHDLQSYPQFGPSGILPSPSVPVDMSHFQHLNTNNSSVQTGFSHLPMNTRRLLPTYNGKNVVMSDMALVPNNSDYVTRNRPSENAQSHPTININSIVQNPYF